MIESSPTMRCSGTRTLMFADTIGKAAIVRPLVQLPGGNHAPEVNELDARRNDERPIRAVWDAHDHDVTLLHEVFLRDERRVLRVLVRVQDRRVVEAQDLAELVRERVADVVDVRLERHAEDADLLAPEIGGLAQLLHDEVRETLVEIDREV